MILCCGEALIDMLPVETAAGGTAFEPHSGGAVFNTAIALGRLDADVGLLSGTSSDFFGDQLRADLRESGVDTRSLIISDRPTTLAFVTFDEGDARYAFYDENTAGRMLTAADIAAVPDAVSAMFFGGISLVAEPCGTSYEALALAEAERRVVMVDPNIRQGFIRDGQAYRGRIQRLLAAAAIIKVSDEDLAWLAPDRSSDEAAADLLAAGATLVVVTHGASGASGFSVHGRIDRSAPKVDVADTVGAGDTFNAGILAVLQARGRLSPPALPGLDADDVAAALSCGIEAAAVTVGRAGADPPWRSELPRSLQTGL